MTVSITQSSDNTYTINSITGVTLEDISAPAYEIEPGVFTPDFAEVYGFSKEEMNNIITTVTALEQATHYKNNIRHKIEKSAGDSLSILGTTADATQMLLYIQCQHLVALSKARSFEDYQKAMQEHAPLAERFLQDVKNGKTKLPFMIKGIEAVIKDVEMRSTQVAEIFENVVKEAL